MDLLKCVNDFIVKNELNAKKVAVALSGGVDSVVLYDLLNKLGMDVIPLHFNHKQRIESDLEQENLEKIYSPKLIIGENKGDLNNSSEEYLRGLRYSFFKDSLYKEKINYLFTGHHLNDKAENFLQRLVKGATVEGLSSFSEKVYNPLLKTTVCRPFVDTVTKEDIYKYAKKNNLTWFEDSSNQSLDYTRNRFRNVYLKELEKENPKLQKHLVSFSNDLAEVQDLIDLETSKTLHKGIARTYLGQVAFETDWFTGKNIIDRNIILNLLDSKKLFKKEQLNSFVEFAKNGKPNTKIQVAENLYLFKDLLNNEEVVVVMKSKDFEKELSETNEMYLSMNAKTFQVFEDKNERYNGVRVRKLLQAEKENYVLRFKNVLIVD